MSLVLFPDATDIVCAILSDGLEDDFGWSVPVRSKVPDPRPDTFVVVRRTGGPRRNIVTDTPTLVVESYGLVEEQASDLSQMCRALLFASRATVVDGVAVYRVGEFAGPAYLPDPTSDHHRYTQTVTVALRGAAPSAS